MTPCPSRCKHARVPLRVADIQPLSTLRYDPPSAGSLEDVDRAPVRRDRRAMRAAARRAQPVQRRRDRPARRATSGAAARRSTDWRQRGRRSCSEDEPAIWVLRQDYTAPDGSRPHPHRLLRARARGGLRRRAGSARTSAPTRARRRTASSSRAPRARTSPPSSACSPTPSGARAARRSAQVDGERAVRHGDRRRRHARTRSGASPTRRPVAALQSALADAELLIADGHHRYETARVYAEEIGGEGDHRYVLMLLCSLEDPGLLIFPTHRLLTGLKDDTDKQIAIRDALRRDFDIEELDDPRELEPPAGDGRVAFGYMDSFFKQPVPRHAEGPGDRRPRAGGHARALPPARHRRARGARPARRARHVRGRHLAPARPRLLEGPGRRHRRGGDRPRRRRLLHARHAGRAGARGGGGRRVDAAQVDLLLPEDPDRPGVQSTDDEDLHAQGRRRHHRPLVRRPGAEVRRPPGGVRLGRRGRLGARAGARRRRARRRALRATSCASRTSCSWRAPSWRPRPRPPSASRPACRRSRRRWSTGSNPTSTATWSASSCRPSS